MDVHKNVVGLGGPSHCAIAEHLPQLSLGDEVRHPGEVSADVVERGCRTEEITFHIFGFAQQHPCVVYEGVVFVAFEPLLLLVGGASAFALGLFLDGVQRNGFLHLLDGAVVVAAGLGGFFNGMRLGWVNEQALGVVVLVVLGELYLLFVVGFAVVVDVVAGVERMPKARAGGVFLGAALAQDQHRRYG